MAGNDKKMIDHATDGLIQAVVSSKQYTQYIECMNRIKKQKDINDKFTEFRKKYLNLIWENDENLDAIERLQQEYHEILINADVDEFIESNDRICQTMKEIYMKLAEGITLDIDFLDD